MQSNEQKCRPEVNFLLRYELYSFQFSC